MRFSLRQMGRYARMPAAGIMALGTALAALSCQGGYQVRVESLTIGMESTAVNSLVYIAQEQKYFAANGLRITIKDHYPSGAAAVDGILRGEVDIATAAELAIVRQAFAKGPVQTFGTIDMFMHMKLIARKDRGIRDISDLKGKRLGVPLKSQADFNLGRFLDLNFVDRSEIDIVDIQAPRAVSALMDGDADAVVAWQPNVMELKKRLGDNAAIWSVHNGQPIYCALVAGSAWAKEHPELVVRFLKALLQAEEYLVKDNDGAKSLLQGRLGYEDAYMNEIWPEHEFSLRLDQSLILAMEDEARWMISNNLTTEKTIPDFLDYIYEDGLKAVKPGAVNIVR